MPDDEVFTVGVTVFAKSGDHVVEQYLDEAITRLDRLIAKPQDINTAMALGMIAQLLRLAQKEEQAKR